MNQKKKQSRSVSRKKSSYAPIMLTSKAVKPTLKDNLLQSNQKKSQSNHKFRTKLTKNNKHSQLQLTTRQQIESNIPDIDKLKMTQHNINNHRHTQLDKTFSHSCKKTKMLDVCTSQIISNGRQMFDQLYNYKTTKKQQKQFQAFYMRQQSASSVVKVQFNQQNISQKVARKNNANSHRYNVVFAYGNSPHNTSRPYKSVVPTSKNLSQYKDGQQVIIQINDDKGNKIIQRKNMCVSANKPFESFMWLKDPNKKLMLTQKQKPLDLTFTNFKQKIYQKKISKISNHRTKYNQEWNQYLNRYYLNIKKVKPLVKFDQNNHKEEEEGVNRQAKSSAQIFIDQIKEQKDDHAIAKRMIKINSIYQGSYDHIHSQKMDRIKSSTLMASSKTTSALSSVEVSPQLSPKKGKNHDSDQSKIQSDIITKRINSNRKDYFVFSMGDNSNQNKIQNPTLIKFSMYKDFLWKVNFSNGLHVRFPDDIQKPYKLFVGRGNNSAIIKGIMRRRFWWQLVDKIIPEVNFVWTQLRVNDFVKSQKKRKHQHLKHLLDSASHFESLTLNYNQTVNPAFKQSYQSHKKIFKGNDLSLWLSHFKHHSKNQQKYVQQSGCNILQKRLKTMVKRKRLSFIDSSITSQQKSHNHFQCNYYIGNKKALFYAMRKYYKLYGKDPFDYIPLTFHISGGLEDPEFNQFLEKYNIFNEERMKNKNSDLKNIWIVKPGEVTNRGRGITVCATLDEIKIRLKSKQKNSDGSLRTYILQKYIQKPLLYQKRKFDIRHYMLMTCVNGQIKGYWYQQGYIRTTSTQYNIKNCKDLYTHLTNDAIQKNSSDYGKYQKGNKISYEQFQKYLTKNYRKDFDFFEEILPKMKKLATDAMRATYSIIEPNRRQNNFQLFGLDFMLDQSMKVYLIQCNTNPCLELSCPLLAKIISGLIENVFKICIDPIFPPPFQWPNSKKFQMGDNALNDMKFQLVFDQICDGKELEKLYGTEKGFGNKIGKVEEEEQQYEDDGAQEEEWNEDQNP